MKTFTFVPSYSTTADFQLNAAQVQFGDGYMQRVSAGVNVNRMKYSVGFNNRTPDEISQILAFLLEHQGTVAFGWNPPPPWNLQDSPVITDNGTTYTAGQKVKNGSYVYMALTTVSNATIAGLTNRTNWLFIGKVPLKFICLSGNWQSSDYFKTNLTATFEQVFE